MSLDLTNKVSFNLKFFYENLVSTGQNSVWVMLDKVIYITVKEIVHSAVFAEPLSIEKIGTDSHIRLKYRFFLRNESGVLLEDAHIIVINDLKKKELFVIKDKNDDRYIKIPTGQDGNPDYVWTDKLKEAWRFSASSAESQMKYLRKRRVRWNVEILKAD